MIQFFTIQTGKDEICNITQYWSGWGNVGTLPLDNNLAHLSKLKLQILLDPTVPFLRTFPYRSTNLSRQRYEFKDV